MSHLLYVKVGVLALGWTVPHGLQLGHAGRRASDGQRGRARDGRKRAAVRREHARERVLCKVGGATPCENISGAEHLMAPCDLALQRVLPPLLSMFLLQMRSPTAHCVQLSLLPSSLRPCLLSEISMTLYALRATTPI